MSRSYDDDYPWNGKGLLCIQSILPDRNVTIGTKLTGYQVYPTVAKLQIGIEQQHNTYKRPENAHEKLLN